MPCWQGCCCAAGTRVCNVASRCPAVGWGGTQAELWLCMSAPGGSYALRGRCCASWLACLTCLASTGSLTCSAAGSGGLRKSLSYQDCAPGSSAPLPDRDAAVLLTVCWHGRLHRAARGGRPQAGLFLDAASRLHQCPAGCRSLDGSSALQLKACLPLNWRRLLLPDPTGTNLHNVQFYCQSSAVMHQSKDLLCCGFPASQSLLQVVKRLPLVKVAWREPRLMPVQRREERAEGSLAEGAEPQQWQLEIRLQRAGGGRAGTSAARVYAPRFPKACLASCPDGYISSIASKVV